MKRFVSIGLATAALFIAGVPDVLCSSAPNPKSSGHLVLAKVNGEPVSDKDLLDLFTDRHSGHAKFLGGPNEARTFLNIVIDDRLLVQEAYEIGLDQDETVRTLVDEFEGTKAGEALIKEEIDDKAAPGPDEVRAIWTKYMNLMIQGRQIAVATKEEAEEIRTALLHGADFEELARSCSIARSGLNGGHFLTNWGEFEPAWENAVFALEPAVISPVIETRDGYEIVIVDNLIPAERLPFDKVSSEIDATLRRRRTEERKKAFAEELWSKYHVVMQPVDLSPASLTRLRATAPAVVLATWDGGGKATVADVFEPSDLATISTLLPRRARYEIDSRLRMTVNDSLVRLEAKARTTAGNPKIAAEVEQYRNYVMESVLYRDHIFRELTVTDDDVRKYYDAHASDFAEPAQRHVAHIMVANEADAKTVREKLAAGGDFAEMAKKYSRDFATALSAGDLGWITAEKVPDSFKEVLSLKDGEVSKPIRSDSGWHIVKVLEIKPPRTMPFDEAKEKVKEKVLDDKRRAAREFWVKKLRDASKIEIDDAAIAQFVKENQMTSTEAPSPNHTIPAGAPPVNHSTEPNQDQ